MVKEPSPGEFIKQTKSCPHFLRKRLSKGGYSIVCRTLSAKSNLEAYDFFIAI
jgi:hypothetical protein